MRAVAYKTFFTHPSLDFNILYCMIASVPSFQLTDERTFFARTASPPSELGELFHNEENEEDKLNALMEMKRSRERAKKLRHQRGNRQRVKIIERTPRLRGSSKNGLSLKKSE